MVEITPVRVIVWMTLMAGIIGVMWLIDRLDGDD